MSERKQPWLEPVAVDGVWLIREGDNAIVLVSVNGEWRRCITEYMDGPISHCVSASGIRQASRDKINDVPGEGGGA